MKQSGGDASFRAAEARNKFSKNKIMTRNLSENTDDPVKTLTKPKQKDWQGFSVQQIVGASIHQDNQAKLNKIQSQHNGQGGKIQIPGTNLVFTRQVYMPELCINQDTNRQNIMIDQRGPFTWHVNLKNDECYICHRWRYCLLFFSRKRVMEG